MKPNHIFYLILMSFSLIQCNTKESGPLEVQQWKETELTFTSGSVYDNPYTDVEFWVEFTDPDGNTFIRPGYWEKDNVWKVRFASPVSSGQWTWKSFASNESDPGLHGKSGKLKAIEYRGDNLLIKKRIIKDVSRQKKCRPCKWKTVPDDWRHTLGPAVARDL